MRCSAEFAKVAMAGQKLDEDEVLNIRWAFADPNPIAKESIARSNRDALIIGLQAKGIRWGIGVLVMHSLQETGYQYPATYQPQTDMDNENPNALPDTSAQFDRAALQGYGVLGGSKKNTKKGYVETKEFEGDAYEQATNALEDEELEQGIMPEYAQQFIHENGLEIQNNQDRLNSVLDKIDEDKKKSE